MEQWIKTLLIKCVGQCIAYCERGTELNKVVIECIKTSRLSNLIDHFENIDKPIVKKA